ncbi:hypothetical protein DGo_PC0189 (plasmid) [Deinococcus gobiensis I-0]|uniref:Uncharacterized protein n=1 Tax=Deinococcus gobiensis (strain DSM 21396 / JCM 16679 / CGMCC 1.7299 / I-0) TaxID=745776 RepID=H8H384_DEIGI|nr:hypothetical protein DGo_PC0189 [Deinococcus gobiensis I-0]
MAQSTRLERPSQAQDAGPDRLEHRAAQPEDGVHPLPVNRGGWVDSNGTHAWAIFSIPVQAYR